MHNIVNFIQTYVLEPMVFFLLEKYCPAAVALRVSAVVHWTPYADFLPRSGPRVCEFCPRCDLGDPRLVCRQNFCKRHARRLHSCVYIQLGWYPPPPPQLCLHSIGRIPAAATAVFTFNWEDTRRRRRSCAYIRLGGYPPPPPLCFHSIGGTRSRCRCVYI